MRLCFFAFLLVACGGAPPAPAHALTLDGLAADGSAAPLVEGQEVTLVEGAQGGFHVWLRYAYDGIPGTDATLTRTAHRVSDDVLVLRSTADTTIEALSEPLPMFMCPSPVGIDVIDTPIAYTLDLTDGVGTELAKGTITLVPRCPVDEATFCQQICTG
ncbi:MAG: hypothetical protein ABI321_00400 [Polyangia bacterium]